jgi:hypothetical protein
MPDVLFRNVHAVVNYTVTGSKQVPNAFKTGFEGVR